MKTRYELLGTLPRGDWKFCLVRIRDKADAILVVDASGQNAPRMVIGTKLVTL